MRIIGFSTGALARGDFERGLFIQRSRAGTAAVELSALREHELQPLADAVPHLDLSGFGYVSVHAPSKIKQLPEEAVLNVLRAFPQNWPLVVHPEIMLTPELWRPLGSRLCIENMDDRKTTGRTVAELRELFFQYPDATFCLDVGHARQIDPTMASAILMLREFGPRLRQLHVSEVGQKGEHLPVSALAKVAFKRVARHVPEDCPLIIESVIPAEAVSQELEAVEDAFNTLNATTTQQMAFA